MHANIRGALLRLATYGQRPDRGPEEVMCWTRWVQERVRVNVTWVTLLGEDVALQPVPQANAPAEHDRHHDRVHVIHQPGGEELADAPPAPRPGDDRYPDGHRPELALQCRT